MAVIVLCLCGVTTYRAILILVAINSPAAKITMTLEWQLVEIPVSGTSPLIMQLKG